MQQVESVVVHLEQRQETQPPTLVQAVAVHVV
jgi:hypothetical protein